MPPSMKEHGRPAFGDGQDPEQTVDRILTDVAARGDEAVRQYTRSLDGWDGEAFELSGENMAEAARSLAPDLLAALEEAAGRVRAFHQACLPVGWFDEAMGLGQ
ncbi:MAG: histidinol dehydrogenase, partial [Chloroflexi bacterium]|nr:histidinol dehydrogenase [Chloroflexota bacterium]